MYDCRFSLGVFRCRWCTWRGLDYLSFGRLIFIIFCVFATSVRAFVVQPSLSSAFHSSGSGLTFRPSGDSPLSDSVAVAVAGLSVGGSTRYLPIVARAGAAAVSALEWGIMRNPVVLVGTTALAYYASRGFNLNDGQLTKRAPAGPITSRWVGNQGPLYSSGCEVDSDSADFFRECARTVYTNYGKGSLLKWAKDFSCVDTLNPKGEAYFVQCSFQPMYLSQPDSSNVWGWVKAYDYPVPSTSVPQVPATFGDLPHSAPPFNDVPVPVPIDSVSVGPLGSSTFSFQLAPSEKMADGRYSTTVIDVSSAGTSSNPSLVNILSRVVVSASPMTLGDATSPPVVAPLLPLPGVPGIPFGDGTFGSGASVEKPAVLPVPVASVPVLPASTPPVKQSESPGLCDLFPDILACATVDTPAADDLVKKDVSLDIRPVDGWAGGSGSCPSSARIRDGIEFSFRPLCDGLQLFRPVFLAVAWVVAGLIVIGARGGSD